MSIVIMTLQLKQNHRKEEGYPISLDQLVSRANIGSDADIRLVGYTMSCQLATGNDCSTVSLNVAHSGPWVRRGDSSTDTFDQQFVEHTVSVSPKGCLFRKSLIGRSEREYLNPDTKDNFIVLRVRDPCGVIPGVVARIEFRAELIRPVPSSVFMHGDEAATDRYEDQDVSNGAPAPPSAVKHVPAVMYLSGFVYTADSTGSSIRYDDTDSRHNDYFDVTRTTPPQAVSGTFRPSSITNPDLQREFTQAGYDGNITYTP